MFLKCVSRKNSYTLILASLFLIAASTSYSQGFLKADGKKIVNEKGENVLLRGIGLGGWMLQEGYMLHVYKESQQHRIRERIQEQTSAAQTEEFYTTWLQNNTRKIDIDSLKAWGFNSVRLPMHYNLYTLPPEKEPVPGQNTWLEKGFQMTDSLVKWCKANKMYLILDLHAAPGGQGNDLNISDRDSSLPSLWDSEANKQKTIALWNKLATRYANEPTVGAYDILNEPNWGFTDKENDKHGQKEEVNGPLKELLMEITKTIRSVDQKHIIIIEGNAWGNNYNGMLPPWDKNMVLSFHKYWNYNKTKDIQKMLDTRDKYNVPVWVGESGENSNTWYTEAIRLFEDNNIGWAWWPLKKMGANNPLEIKSNLNYDHFVSFLNGEGKSPKESDVYSGVLELATYAKLENCIYHKDVTDAMFRQVRSNTAIPFKSNKVANKTILQAVDYDMGRNGSAYYDLDTANYSAPGQKNVGNSGHVYRNDGVDIKQDSSKYERFYVTDIDDGEWLQYTVYPDVPGTYTLRLFVGGESENASATILVNGKTVASNIALPKSDGPVNWKTVDVKSIKLNRSDKIRILANKGGFTFAQVQFLK